MTRTMKNNRGFLSREIYDRSSHIISPEAGLSGSVAAAMVAATKESAMKECKVIRRGDRVARALIARTDPNGQDRVVLL